MLYSKLYIYSLVGPLIGFEASGSPVLRWLPIKDVCRAQHTKVAATSEKADAVHPARTMPEPVIWCKALHTGFSEQPEQVMNSLCAEYIVILRIVAIEVTILRCLWIVLQIHQTAVAQKRRVKQKLQNGMYVYIYICMYILPLRWFVATKCAYNQKNTHNALQVRDLLKEDVARVDCLPSQKVQTFCHQ